MLLMVHPGFSSSSKEAFTLRILKGCTVEITEVKVFPVDEEKLKAYITVVLDNCFVVRDLKIISGTAGLFVAMPSKKRKDGTFKDIAHPLNQSTRAVMEKKILEAYLTEIKNPSARVSQTAEEAERADT
jgi:stage V sporulation protein G